MRAAIAGLAALIAWAPAVGGAADRRPPSSSATAEEPLAPDAREVLRTCRDPIFIDCFKQWRPFTPAPPKKPEPPEGATVPPPPPPAADAAKPEKPKPPPESDKPADESKPDPDMPAYEALLRAINELGLQDKLKLNGPPAQGAVTLQTKILAPPPSTAGRGGRSFLTAPITEDER